MATVYNTETSQFVKSAANILAENKVGQYSKYLDSNPIMVTYYSVNMVMSRADIGTGKIYDELGKSSPLRYNKIKNFPVYHVSGLQPNIMFEDGHYDAEIDLNDVTILPNTVKPKPNDFFLVELPNSPRLLFRVNEFRVASIQSNDFYQVSADLRVDTEEGIKDIERLVVETYECIFENIGTQNNCFIKSEDLSNANIVNGVVSELTNLYRTIYYNPSTSDYIYTEVYPGPTMWNTSDLHSNMLYSYYYDIYLTKFINDSMIFCTNDYSATSALTMDDTIPNDFEYRFKQTLWYTILTRDTKMLYRYPYCHYPPISKPYSPLITEQMKIANGIALVMSNNGEYKNPYLHEYFSHELLRAIICNEDLIIKDPEESNDESLDFDSVISLNNVVNGKCLNQECEMAYRRDEKSPNIFRPTTKYIKSKVDPDITPAKKVDEELLKFENCYELIIAYIRGISGDIDYNKIFDELKIPSMTGYRITPIIIYILKKKYSDYFTKQVTLQ